jgi:hypothetical protein
VEENRVEAVEVEENRVEAVEVEENRVEAVKVEENPAAVENKNADAQNDANLSNDIRCSYCNIIIWINNYYIIWCFFLSFTTILHFIYTYYYMNKN